MKMALVVFHEQMFFFQWVQGEENCSPWSLKVRHFGSGQDAEWEYDIELFVIVEKLLTQALKTLRNIC